MMNQKQRKAVLETLDALWTRWEDSFPQIIAQMEAEHIEYDFFEDLYDIIYDFHYNERKLLARIEKLFEQAMIHSHHKNEENRYN